MLTMKDIIREGHPTLETVAEPVTLPLDVNTMDTLTEMRQFLLNSQDEEIREKHELREGAGLAAPQMTFVQLSSFMRSSPGSRIHISASRPG